MTKPFFVELTPSSEYQAMVFATGVASPMDALDEITKELAEEKVMGPVIFDLLLTNGNKTNRYWVGHFDGSSFNRDAINSAMSEYEGLTHLSADALKKHFFQVNPILLSKAMCFALKNGIPA